MPAPACPTSNTSRAKFFATRSPPSTSRAPCGEKLARDGSRLTADETTLDLAAYPSVRAVAIGKAAVAMARGLADLLAPDIPAHRYSRRAARLHRRMAAAERARAFAPSAPDIRCLMPAAWTAARAILDLLAGADARTLIFFLLSGGGSALVELPLHPGVTLDDVRELYRLLVDCGAPIDEINVGAQASSRRSKAGAWPQPLPRPRSSPSASATCPTGASPRWPPAPRCPTQRRQPTPAASSSATTSCPNCPPAFRAIFSHPERIPETPKPGDPAFARNHFLLLLGTERSARPRAASRRRKRVRRRLRQLHRRLAHRRSRRLSCSRGSSGCATPIPAAASPSLPMAKSARR